MIKAILLIVSALFAMLIVGSVFRDAIINNFGIEYFHPSVSLIVISMFLPILYFNRIWFRQELIVKNGAKPEKEHCYVLIVGAISSYLYVLSGGFGESNPICIICYFFTELSILCLATARQIWSASNGN